MTFGKRQRRDAAEFDPDGDHRSYDVVDVPHFDRSANIVRTIDKTTAACQIDGKRSFIPAPRPGGARKKYCLHPSQSEGCPRKVQFSILEARKDSAPPDPQLERVFDMGHEMHRMLQGYLFEAWKRSIGDVTRVWEDVELDVPDVCGHGELDAIVELKGRYRLVVEIKTVSSNVYAQLKQPKSAWVWQAHLYMRGVGLTNSVILVMCRDNGRLMEFDVPWSDETWDEIEDQALTVLAAIEDGEVVPAEPSTGECRWCNHNQICKSPKLQKKIDFDAARDAWE